MWGAADAGESVTVSFAGQTASTTADSAGFWRVTLAPLAVSSTATLTLTGTNTVLVEAVLVGELWLASGQSNMNLRVEAAATAEAEVSAADFTLIRHFRIPERPENAPIAAASIRGDWQPWMDDPVATLANSADMPAAPFRSDTW